MSSPAHLRLVDTVTDEHAIGNAVMDAQINNLLDMAGSARWSEALARAVGQALVQEKGEMEHRHTRQRTEMRREARENAFRLARWADAMMRHYGQWWYDQAVRLNMTSLDRQTLYNLHGLLRVPEGLRDTDVYPSVMLAATAAGSPEAVENLLRDAEITGATTQQVARQARVMNANKLTDVPVLPASGDDSDMPDAPRWVGDWWARYTERVSEWSAWMQTQRIQEVDTLRWSRVWHELGQEVVKHEEGR